MAANLEQKMVLNENGELVNQVSFVYTEGVKPWHKQGRMFPELTQEIAYNESGMAFDVDKTQVETTISGTTQILPKRFITYRKDTGKLFDVVSDRYEVIQNFECFKVVETLVNNHSARLQTAGVIGNGSRVFFSMKTPKNITVAGSNDVIEEYLICVNEHTGDDPLYIIFSPTLPVCENTVNMALRNAKNKFSIRHSKGFRALFNNPEILQDTMLKAMHLEDAYLQKAESLYNAMAQTRYNINEFLCNTYLTAEQIKAAAEVNFDYNNVGTFPITVKGKDKDREIISTRQKNIFDKIVDYYHTDKFGQEFNNRKGTLYGIFNAVTGYYSNVKEYDSEEAKFESVIFGNAALNSQKAFTFAENLILS
jgi:phage/plasmid-like protein (TIGR03299 family)